MSTSVSFEDGQRILAKKVIGRTAFRPFKVEVLQKLCEDNGISVTDTSIRGVPKKEDYVAALLNFRLSRGLRTLGEQETNPTQTERALHEADGAGASDGDHDARTTEKRLVLGNNGALNLKLIERELGKTGIFCVVDPTVLRRSHQGTTGPGEDHVDSRRQSRGSGIFRVVVADQC